MYALFLSPCLTKPNISWWTKRCQSLPTNSEEEPDFNTEDCTLDLAALEKLLTRRTKLLAVGYASNAVGTINDVKHIGKMVHGVGGMIFVDAVHYAPHGPIDVQEIDCDFLACSAYKFFGPHVGVLYGKHEVLEKLPPYKVRPQQATPPNKFETGTLNHEGLAGTSAAIEYLADIGKNYGDAKSQPLDQYQGRRRDLKLAMAAIQQYERELSSKLLAGLKNISGLKIYGITDEKNFSHRTPTFAIRFPNITPEEVARRLGEQSIFVWDGNFYALEVTTRLGVEEHGGVVRIGLAHYNTVKEIEQMVRALSEMN